MSKLDELHNAAMEKADEAFGLKRKQDSSYIDYFKESLSFELQALDLLYKQNIRHEPTYSVLHRSAATLALDCGEIRLAEKIISKALAEDPPQIIAEELRDLLEQVYFARHLELRGIFLEDDEFQISLSGRGVGFGIIQSQYFLDRVDNLSKIFYRLGERKLNKPFREKGQPTQDIKNNYEVFLSPPRAASFAVTMKIGKPTDQQKLPGILDSHLVIEEFIDLMNDLNIGNESAIKEKIPDETYRTNFIQLGKRLAPDGEDISLVGFTYKHLGIENQLKFTRTKHKIDPKSKMALASKIKSNSFVIDGILRFADDIKDDQGKIKIVNQETGKPHLVHVPKGMMNDIVRPLWGMLVKANVTRKGDVLILDDID